MVFLLHFRNKYNINSLGDIMAIGIYDSGIGGLTVYKAVAAYFKKQDLIYLGDVARVPYGNRSKETIIRYSVECASFLKEKYNISALIAACNTISSHAIPDLDNSLNIPVLGVIKPGAKYAVDLTKNKKIGVLGTHATVNSKSYIHAIKEILPDAQVYQQACPLFVPLVEEAVISGKMAETVVEETLKNIAETDIDTVILGCTHYPVLKDLIAKYLPNVSIVDSTHYIIEDIKKLNLSDTEKGLREVLVTDDTPAFLSLKNILVGNVPVQVVDINK